MSLSWTAIVLLGMLVLVSGDHHHGPPGMPGMGMGGQGGGGGQGGHGGDGDRDRPIIDYGGIKPGMCPVEETGGFSICGGTPCRGDEECPGNDKCCQRSCGELCMPVSREVEPMGPEVDGGSPVEIVEHPGVCPMDVGDRPMCTGTTCSNDGDCQGFEKCCFDFECGGAESRCMPAPQIQPVPEVHVPLGPKPPVGPETRSGSCPDEVGATPYCDGPLCIYDGECDPGEKCCSSATCGDGLRCMPAPQIQPVPPVQPRSGSCPLLGPIELGNCEGQECLTDGDCFDNEKCCGSACGYHCTIAVIEPPVLQECSGDLVYLECNSACPEFCGRSPEAALCMQMCEPGCGCPSGTIRRGDGSDVCVAENDCPDGGMDQGGPNKQTGDSQCTGDLEFDDCAVTCQLTCDEPNMRPCIKMCGIGCYCPNGMIRESLDSDRCFADVSSCSSIPEPEPKSIACTGDLVFNECGTVCEQTCYKPDPQICTTQCMPGCFCPSGTLRVSMESDTCVAFDVEGPNDANCPEEDESRDARPCENERRMKMEESGDKAGVFIPQCTQDGYYAMEQCYEGNGSYCWCADTQTGVVIPDSEVHGVRADCDRFIPDPSILNQCPEGKVFADGVKKCVSIIPDPSILNQCPEGKVFADGVKKCVDPEPPVLQECPGDFVYLECNSACPEFCGRSPEAALCMQMCEPGCGCPSGTMRLSENSNICVTEENCPVPEPEPEQRSPECTGDLVYLECNSACPEFCGMSPEAALCIEMCMPGCGCPSGTMRSSENSDVCVTEQECPVTCPNNLEFSSCGTACPLTCNEPDPEVCIAMCVSGCVCPEGMYLSPGDSPSCFVKEECPENCPLNYMRNENNECVPPTCDGDLVYQNCGTACPNMCNEPEPMMCTFQCVLECQCPQDMHRIRGTSRCVAENACPASCEEGYKHNENLECVVANPCPERLAAVMADGLLIGEDRPECTAEGKYEEVQCSGSTGFCWCADIETGVEKQGTAIRGTPDCSAPVPTCDGDMEYKTCGSPCPSVCNQPEDLCIFECVIGCQCPEGTWLVPGEDPPRCVAFEDCPAACDNGGRYEICGGECRDYCGKPDNEPCISICRPGCVCPEGTVLIDPETEVCVPKADCPSLPVVPTIPDVPVPVEVNADVGFQCPPKRGHCPYTLEMETNLACTKECQDDYDCVGERRCCSHSCGSICTYPDFPVPQPDPSLFPPVPTSPPAGGMSVDSCPAQDAAVTSCGASCTANGDCAAGEMCCTNDACDGSICLPMVTEQMCTTVPCPVMEASAPSDLKEKVCGSDFIYIVKIRSDKRAKILDDLKYNTNPYADPSQRPIISFVMDDVCNVEMTGDRYIIFMDGNASNVPGKKLTLDHTVLAIPLTGHVKAEVKKVAPYCPIA